MDHLADMIIRAAPKLKLRSIEWNAATLQIIDLYMVKTVNYILTILGVQNVCYFRSAIERSNLKCYLKFEKESDEGRNVLCKVWKDKEVIHSEIQWKSCIMVQGS